MESFFQHQGPPPAYTETKITSVTQPESTVITQTVEKKPNSMRQAIPALPIPLAILYGILNFVFPGLGTILSGFSVLCCGNVGQSGGGRVGTFCINFWVGILQFLLIPILLIGWIWSIIWGIALITIAANPGKVTTTTTVVTTEGPPVVTQTNIVTLNT